MLSYLGLYQTMLGWTFLLKFGFDAPELVLNVQPFPGHSGGRCSRAARGRRGAGAVPACRAAPVGDSSTCGGQLTGCEHADLKIRCLHSGHRKQLWTYITDVSNCVLCLFNRYHKVVNWLGLLIFLLIVHLKINILF